MPKRKQFHVTGSRGEWGVTNSNKKFSTKQEAVKHGREEAKKHGNSQLLIHNIDWKISDEHTYGNDPYPPKG